MNHKRFVAVLACLLAALSFVVAVPKAVEDINIVEEVPVSEKGYTLDPASPYLPPVSGLANNMVANGEAGSRV